VAQPPEVVVDVEFANLAQATELVGDYPEAEEYWQKAIAASPTAYYTIINKRGYASFLVRNGEHQKGRKVFEDALAIWPNTTDYNKFVNGFTYQFWAGAETTIPGRGRADNLFKEANDIYDTISNAVLKANVRRNLNYARGNPLGRTPSSGDVPGQEIR